jgi:hypothetical protein
MSLRCTATGSMTVGAQCELRGTLHGACFQPTLCFLAPSKNTLSALSLSKRTQTIIVQEDTLIGTNWVKIIHMMSLRGKLTRIRFLACLPSIGLPYQAPPRRTALFHQHSLNMHQGYPLHLAEHISQIQVGELSRYKDMNPTKLHIDPAC